MKTIIVSLLLTSVVLGDCRSLINADTLDVNFLIKKYYYPHTDLFPKIQTKDQDYENKIHKRNIRECFEQQKMYEDKCSFEILTYFSKDTTSAIEIIEQLKIIKEKYMSITNPILLGNMEQLVCNFKAYFINYEYFQKLIYDLEVPKITSEEFFQHVDGKKKSKKVELYIDYFQYSYMENNSNDYKLFEKKISQDPLLNLLASYLKKNPTSPFAKLSNDSLLFFVGQVLKLDPEYLNILINDKHVFTIMKKIEYAINDRWLLLKELEKEGNIQEKKKVYEKQVNFFKAPGVKKIVGMVGQSLSVEEKSRSIYPQIQHFVDSLQSK